MYENFLLKHLGQEEKILKGYHWPIKKPAYVLCQIHGIGECADRYERMNKFINDVGIAVLSMDLPGHGESFGKRGHCAPRAEILKDVDQLIQYGQEKYPETGVILYGHSMGGNIALDYRKRGNCNGIPIAYIISAPWIELVRPVAKPLYQVLKILAHIVPSVAISSNVSQEDLGHPDSVEPYQAHPLVHNKISILTALDGFDTGKALAKGRLQDNGGASKKPMLLMHGTEDKVCDIQGSDKIAKQEECTYIPWQGLYHEIHNGSKESNGTEVIQKMIQWIQELQG